MSDKKRCTIGRFGATAAVIPQIILFGNERLHPARTFVNPPPALSRSDVRCHASDSAGISGKVERLKNFKQINKKMTKLNLFGILLLFATATFASDPNIAPSFATTWKNGVAQNLTDGNYDASANSIFVSGNDVYVVGYDSKGNRGSSPKVAMLWKNGVAQELTSELTSAIARSVFVSGNDVYVVGVGSFQTGWIEEGWRSYGNSIAVLWKNGVEQKLTDGTRRASANSVYVSNNDVYVAGSIGGNAVLWKNGKEECVIEGFFYSQANSVFVFNNDVYMAGQEGRTAKLWKNGVAENLSNGDEFMFGQSVFVSNNDVYIAGYEQYKIAKLWKNGELQNVELQNLDDDLRESVAHSVFVDSNDLYVVGYKSYRRDPHWISHGTLWKNGVAHDFFGDNARSVYVLGNDVYVAGSIRSEE